MIINGNALLKAAPIKGMLTEKVSQHGVSHGLAEVGYDIRIKQAVKFTSRQSKNSDRVITVQLIDEGLVGFEIASRFTLASAIEEFDMPNNLMGVVHDKSTWARQGLSVFNTVIEPGWKGFLTLELAYHGNKDLIIPAYAGIAQVVFHKISEPRAYKGKYQNQENKPVPARS